VICDDLLGIRYTYSHISKHFGDLVGSEKSQVKSQGPGGKSKYTKMRLKKPRSWEKAKEW